MRKNLWKAMMPFIIGASIFGSIALFNQLNQFAITVSHSHLEIYYLIWIFYIILGIITLMPIIRILFLPKALKRPYIDSPPDDKRKFYYEYKKRILKEYNKKIGKTKLHHYVTKDMIHRLESANGIHTIKSSLALIEEEMDKAADKEIKKYAKAVFTSTAISQNGTLDAVFILKLQIELVWKLAHIYNQKPRLKEMFNIYVSVLANALAASAMSEISIQEVVDSLLKQITGGVSSFITKGLSKVIDSIFDGTCNALLSLRVGYLAKDYCKYSIEYNEKSSRNKSRKRALKTINEIGVKDTISNLLRSKQEKEGEKII